MSDITKERWTRFGSEVLTGTGQAVSVHADNGLEDEDRNDDALAAIAVLPEVLAWMYKMLGQIQDNRIVPSDQDVLNALDILRRAGVLK